MSKSSHMKESLRQRNRGIREIPKVISQAINFFLLPTVYNWKGKTSFYSGDF